MRPIVEMEAGLGEETKLNALRRSLDAMYAQAEGSDRSRGFVGEISRLIKDADQALAATRSGKIELGVKTFDRLTLDMERISRQLNQVET